MNISEFIETINRLGHQHEAFVFLVDFEMKKPLVFRMQDAESNGLTFNIKGITNSSRTAVTGTAGHFQFEPVSKLRYHEAFTIVMSHIQRGDTYLLNLTFPSNLLQFSSPEELFYLAKAPYKLLRINDFVLYSPECFVRIEGTRIFSYPMKGTINAMVENAEKTLLSNKKEEYEHNTIVDLIRNDLAMVSQDIRVTRFRYIDRIETPSGALLQMSSEICGNLDEDWNSHLGEILVKLLPAGSVSGAPKDMTCRIIREAEQEPRGYYTGIFGVFDGQKLDSAVNIRFIEKHREGYRYRSGGGITFFSEEEPEYRELMDKIYVPLTRNNQDN